MNIIDLVVQIWRITIDMIEEDLSDVVESSSFRSRNISEYRNMRNQGISSRQTKVEILIVSNIVSKYPPI